jgi:ribosomal protein S6
MKTYDLTYIISPEITSEEAESFAKELESFVQNKEGVVIKQNNPVARTLSYQIKKHASGFIGSIEFQLEPEALAELKQVVEKDKKVNRHMIVIKHPAKKEKPRRTRNKIDGESIVEKEAPKEIVIEKKEEPKKPARPAGGETKKVELKDIEQKLEELLG